VPLFFPFINYRAIAIATANPALAADKLVKLLPSTAGS
jgi:hypothetical protein